MYSDSAAVIRGAAFARTDLTNSAKMFVAGSGGTAFGEPIRFLDPRRFFLGARITF